MKCRNFLCANHYPSSRSKFNCFSHNCSGKYLLGSFKDKKSFVVNCDARLRYDRILDTREVKYQINELTFYCVDIDQERNIYYGRTK